MAPTHCPACGHRLPGHYSTCRHHHHHDDDNDVATRHVDHVDDCPGCTTADHDDNGTARVTTRGRDHTCGVY